MSKLFFDLETYSSVPIKHGTHAYAEKAEVLLFAYALDDAEVAVWRVAEGVPMPADLRQAAKDTSIDWWGHNANQFDWVVLKHAMPELYAAVDMTRRFDTMVQAYGHSLPGGLDLLCDIFNLPQDERKLKTGRELIRLFCVPPAKNLIRGRATHKTHPIDWERFVPYAASDISSMRRLHQRMPQWNYPNNPVELALNQLDQRINDRGIQVDVALATAAIDAIGQAQTGLAKRTQTLTDGVVASATQRDKMLAHLLEAYGIELPDLRKSTLERRIDDPNLPLALRELLAVRLQASSTSTAKYQTLLRGVSSDTRLRGTLQFCGASRTGRWAGRLFQPQNLARPTHGQDEIDAGIAAIKTSTVDLLFDNVMAITSSAIRGTIVAPEHKKLCIADLSNIEGRVLAWLAGEGWKLKAFRDFDAGSGHDLYILAYAKAFGVPPEAVTKALRQVGKVMELALGYEGGVGAFLTFSAAYGIDLEAMAEQAFDTLPTDLKQEAIRFYAWFKEQKRSTFGLTERAFVVCDAFKRSWRRAHPMTASLWRELGDAVVMAVNTPGTLYAVRKLKVRRDGNWLRIGLPSGRSLCYPSPRIDGGKFTYMGMNQYSRKWERLASYGGKLCIAAGTLVLTKRGWVSIQNISDQDFIWDGIEWVRTGGAICNGNKPVIEAYGARMTHDHEVLTVQGWTHASQSKRYNRADCRLPHGIEVPRQQRQEIALASGLPMRKRNNHASDRIKKAKGSRDPRVMRLQAQREYQLTENSPRHEPPSGVRGMAQHAGPLPTADTSGLAQLWRTWHIGLQPLAKIVRGLLGRYGADISTGLDSGPPRQQRELRTGQLPLGNLQSASEQSTHVAEVYDLTNCGPRNRFVIAAGGKPLIVHNCENVTQAVARDVLADTMPEVELEGYAIDLTVHDELITETPDTPEYTHTRLAELMSTQPSWAVDLPLAAAGFETYRYRKD